MLGGHDRTKGLLEMLDTGKWIRDKLNLLTKRYLGFSDEAEVRAFQEELDRGCLELDYIARLGKEANQLAIQALLNPKDRQVIKIDVRRNNLLKTKEVEGVAQMDQQVDDKTENERSNGPEENKSKARKKTPSEAEKRKNKENKNQKAMANKEKTAMDMKNTRMHLEPDALQRFRLYQKALEEDEVHLRFHRLLANIGYFMSFELIRKICKLEVPSVYN
ncbi:hypothetical protein P3342_008394 [Pyrenophora teres f. teres]|nr:hypothetical protein P3342_008394 [Pyrenophora teres f. teres]